MTRLPQWGRKRGVQSAAPRQLPLMEMTIHETVAAMISKNTDIGGYFLAEIVPQTPLNRKLRKRLSIR